MEFIRASRPSPIAGAWYSDDPDRLKKDINAYIDGAVLSDDEFNGEVFGIIAPHAGHIYSGKTAGYAYRAVRGLQRDTVVVLSPFHQYQPADLITTAYQSYATPLGEVPVEIDLLNALAGEGLPITQIKQDAEHALEIQLPFLQCALAGDFSLLPLMVRTRDPNNLKTIAKKIMGVLGGRSYLIVASTDLSHFHTHAIAQHMDAEMLRRIKAMDADGVLAAEESGLASACGASSVAILLYAARMKGAASTFILNYSTSADVTGDTSSVVGYGAAAIYLT